MTTVPSPAFLAWASAPEGSSAGTTREPLRASLKDSTLWVPLVAVTAPRHLASFVWLVATLERAKARAMTTGEILLSVLPPPATEAAREE